jgi:hypothetical protein
VRPVSQLHFNQLFSYLYVFFHYSFAPVVVLLGILYLIDAYTSDGQHKELQQQQQWGEQPECQSATTPSTYS